MKIIILTTLLSFLLPEILICQNEATSKLLQEDLRYWYPIGVKQEVLIQILSEGNKNFEVVPRIVNFKRPSTEKIIQSDTLIIVLIKEFSNTYFPAVLYYMYKGYCAGIQYFDLFENLPQWHNILKHCQKEENNHFINQNTVHFVFSLEPEDGIINIWIDIAI